MTLAEGDTTEAILLFAALTASGPRGRLAFPWESLGVERLFQAKLLLAVGDYADAYNVARTFDSPGAVNVIYPLFLRESLEVRLQAAREMGNTGLVEHIESRIASLETGT